MYCQVVQRQLSIACECADRFCAQQLAGQPYVSSEGNNYGLLIKRLGYDAFMIQADLVGVGSVQICFIGLHRQIKHV